jgi:hypothetical protein
MQHKKLRVFGQSVLPAKTASWRCLGDWARLCVVEPESLTLPTSMLHRPINTNADVNQLRAHLLINRQRL